MKCMMRKMIRGFSLVELLLVMVIVSFLTVMGVGYLNQKTEIMRVDRTVLQMQNILNAGLAYYVANNAWPGTAGTAYATNVATNPLLTGNFFPGVFISPWGQPYNYTVPTAALYTMPPNTFVVYV